MGESKHKTHKFWNKLMFRYRLSILNENTLSEAFHMRLSRLSVLLLVIAFSIISFLLLSLLIFFTPIKHFLPGFSDASIRNDLVEEVLLVDSLNNELSLQQRQLDVIKAIMAGDIAVDSINADSLHMTDWKSLTLDKSNREADFCNEYEENERYNLTEMTSPQDAVAQVFFKPAKGVVTHAFDPETSHYGVDITTSADEAVLATLEGTVIFVDYSLDNGYIISIQHVDDYISIYKNCERLLKKVGDKVQAGEAIGFVSSTNSKPTTKPYLSFEIWQRGTPLNPSEYITF